MSFLKFNYLKVSDADYIDELFQKYSQDPNSVDESWRYFFDGLEVGQELGQDPHTSANGLGNGHANGLVNGHANKTALESKGSSSGTPTQKSLDKNQPTGPTKDTSGLTQTQSQMQSVNLSSEAKVADLINAYRERGRLLADLNPLAAPPKTHTFLELKNFGLQDSDLDQEFTAGRFLGLGTAKLSQIIARLKEIYCSSIGIEYTHIQDPHLRDWIQQKLEDTDSPHALEPQTKLFILDRLTKSEGFEQFLHTRYVAQKRFSIEGSESLIPALDRIIEVAAEEGANNIVMGMAHRGRLNVLLNLFGKKPEHIFTEFEGKYKTGVGDGGGDVKYHMGFSADITTRLGKPVHLSLAHNPSHLEFVNPVVEGIARGKQRDLQDIERTQVVPILIHGDAAFAGQGVVYETLNLSQVKGYHTGGTIHLIIDNQVGFTARPEETRSTSYCTDLAKMLEVPIFHVNGDDPEALWRVAGLCTEFRQKFKKDIFIDVICYRKYGHNEGDEPGFTQPLMYHKIKQHPTTRKLYEAQLMREGVVSEEQSQALVKNWTKQMIEAQKRTREENPTPFSSKYTAKWKGLRSAGDADIFAQIDTAVPSDQLLSIGRKINTHPGSFNLHPKLTRFFEARLKALESGSGIDWGNGEALAYATLVSEGHPVRISGQDCERGTFSHRHAIVYDNKTGERYNPFAEINPGQQATFCIYNSTLSETAVLGFEHGWSLADPNVLVVWEAQFGDFGNGAQVIIDQFIASSESKWQRASGLVLLLPHGHEGQGPEHSSARMERYLQLCAENNMSVCNFTLPSQVFHALRRQMKRDFRKPMIVMSPKSMLRNPHAVSELSEFTDGHFQEILDDPNMKSRNQKDKVRRIVLCTGKIYYELEDARSKLGREDVALVRIEQLYPWPGEKLKALLKSYPSSAVIAWVQEEPRNMGAWVYIASEWNGTLGSFGAELGTPRPIRYIGRQASAAPAVGSNRIHGEQQQAIIAEAMNI